MGIKGKLYGKSQLSRGSVSIEASVTLVLLLLVFLLFASFILGFLLQRKSYHELTLYYLGYNHQKIVEKDLEEALGSEYLQMNEGFIMETFNYIENPFLVEESGFTEGAKEVVFITDTGSKYHRPLCPTVDKSLRPITLEEAEESYTPCSICNP